MDEPFAPGELRARRQALGLSQAALAARLNVSSNTVARWERGEVQMQTVGRVRQALEQGQRAEPPQLWGRARQQVPRSLTSFVGREAEVADVRRLLTASRLITLIGVGGIGKTRLAREVATATAEHYTDGVAFVELAPLVDPALLPQVTASVLGVTLPRDHDSPVKRLAEAVSGWQALLVLDNCEHLVGACAEFVDALLRNTGEVRVLATSRQSLGVPGEVVWQVASLPLPEPAPDPSAADVLRSPAVRLFVDRANPLAPDFALTDGIAGSVAEICRRLEGIPLAIELAASQVRVLGVEQIEERLDSRLRLLKGGPRTHPQRQQTLQATFDWSYELLGEAERTLLRRLSVFAGGFTLESAEGVCAFDADQRLVVTDVLDALRGLVDKSLVQVEGHERRARYRLLETVRQCASELLSTSGEAADAARHHRDWYVSWCESVLPELTRRDQLHWYARLALELDNFRAADAWTRADPDGASTGLRLAGALGRYWQVRAPGTEGREWLARAIERGPRTPSVALARALTWLGELECQHGDADVGRGRVEEAVAVARQLEDTSLLSLTLRRCALYAGDHRTAPALLEEAAGVARAAGDLRELSLALGYLGAVYEQQNAVDKAEVLYNEALSTARACEDIVTLIDALDRVGSRAVAHGQFAAAATLLNEGLAHSRALGYDMYTSLAYRKLAQLALRQGDFVTARSHARSSLQVAGGLGREALGLWPLQVAAMLAMRLGHYERTVRMVAALKVWVQRHGLAHDQTLWTYVLPEHQADELIHVASAALGPSAASAAWAAGSALSLKAAIDDALADDEAVPDVGLASGAAHSAPLRPAPDLMTARERQVAELVGRGFTNRQIAEELVITEGTAKLHVGRVLAKLDFHSRAQLAAWIVQQGTGQPPNVYR